MNALLYDSSAAWNHVCLSQYGHVHQGPLVESCLLKLDKQTRSLNHARGVT